MKKLLLLENHCHQDIPKSVIQIINSDWCKKQFEVDTWVQFQGSYHPENRKETVKRLFSADAIIARHVFVDWCQLEIFIKVLTKFKNKGKVMDFYIVHYDLLNTFLKWYDEYEAYTVPDTPKYNNDCDLREQFKLNLNKQFLEVLDYHNIYKISTYLSDYPNEIKPIKSTDIINALKTQTT